MGGSRTVWIGSCGGGVSCQEEAAWVGLMLRNKVQVRCIQSLQGSSYFALDRFALDLWDGSIQQWKRVREWRGLVAKGEVAGQAINAATGHVKLRVVCDEGIPESRFTVNDCSEGNLQPWD